MGLLSSKQGFCVCPRHLPQDGKGFCACQPYISLSVDVPVSLRKLDIRRTGQFCNMKVNLCLIEIRCSPVALLSVHVQFM